MRETLRGIAVGFAIRAKSQLPCESLRKRKALGRQIDQPARLLLATRAEADGEYDPLQRLAVRIYRASGELLRQYTAETLPSRLELLAGEYRVW